MLRNKWLQRLFRHQQLSPVARPSICLPYLSLSLLRARYKRTSTVNERAPNGTYAIELLHDLPAPMLTMQACLPVSISTFRSMLSLDQTLTNPTQHRVLIG